MPRPPIAILGSGVSGLTTAVTLAARGLEAIVYSDEAAAPPASLVAPAMFTPYAPADSLHFRRRTEDSFRVFAALATGMPVPEEVLPPGTPRMDHGVRLGELREYIYAPSAEHAGSSWLDTLLQTRPLTAPPPIRRVTASRRPHIDMDRYVPWLRTAAEAVGVRIQTRRPGSFEEVFALGHSTVINCAGLGARNLAGDQRLKPMHGQVIHVPNDIGLDYSVHDDAPGGLVAYIFNFGDRLVLGGTFDTGRENTGTDELSLAGIVERCRNLLRLDGHPQWADLAGRRMEARAASRPSRGEGATHEDIRLEREHLEGGRCVVHNYGHGRTGVTLSWGCAREVADLVAGVPGHGGRTLPR